MIRSLCSNFQPTRPMRAVGMWPVRRLESACRPPHSRCSPPTASGPPSAARRLPRAVLRLRDALDSCRACSAPTPPPAGARPSWPCLHEDGHAACHLVARPLCQALAAPSTLEGTHGNFSGAEAASLCGVGPAGWPGGFLVCLGLSPARLRLSVPSRAVSCPRPRHRAQARRLTRAQ